MKFLLVEEDKKKDTYLCENTTQEIDSLGNPLTQEQINYFRNSKVRDGQGNLKVCSHNSFSKFDAFDKSKIGDGLNFGKGFYFFDNVPNKVPKEFGENQYLCYMNITNPAILDDPKEFATVLNKLGFSGYEDMLSDPWYEIADVFDNFDVDYEDIANTVATVGYDGIWVPKYGEVIAFEPNQIKLITNTNPTSSDKLNEDISLQDKHAVRGFADECKVDGLPLMDYKEFSELLNEQGMKPNEELYQVYVDAYNNEEDTDYIEVIKKKFEKMSSNEIIDLLGIPNNTNIDSDSPMFILPNGSIISVAQAGKLIGQSLEDNIHSDMIYVILSAIAKKYDYDWDMDDGYYEERKLSHLTYDLEWARLNCGNTWTEGRFYCVLPNHMTSAQYRSLEKWLEWGADNKEQVLVFVGSYEDNQTYYFNETFPEDIIKKIKRYYSSGKLYENGNELKENMDIKPGDRVKMDYYAKPNNGATGTCKGRIGQLCSIEWDDGSKSKEITTYLTKIDDVDESVNTSNDITNEVQRAVDNIMKNKSKYKNQDDLESAIYSVVANCFSGMHGVTRDTADMIADVYEKELKRVELEVNESYANLTEANELEQRAKKHKKKSKGMGWHMSMNAGDVEKGIEVFNNSTSLGSGTSGGEGTAMGEDLEKHLYYYDGPIYYRGNKISTFSNIYTTAKSFGEAARNILFKAAKGDKELWHYDIVDDEIKQMPNGKLERPKCQQCGYEINDNGDCPICDYGEDDLLESLSDLEALWTLRNLD